MPPRPISSRISSWGKNEASSAGVGGMKPLEGAAPPADGDSVPRPTFRKHSGQRPRTALSPIGLPQCSQILPVAITAIHLLPREKVRKVPKYFQEPARARKRHRSSSSTSTALATV